jgi:large subunit ribosomal protein L3
MSPGILGKKIGMAQVFRPDGQVVPVTLLKAGPCVVVQRKSPVKDGYDAVQLGLLEFAKAKNLTKPLAGHIKKAGVEGVRFLRELRLKPGDGDLKTGDRVLVDQFKPSDKVDVIGVSKGRGFAAWSSGTISAAATPRTARCSTGRLVRSAPPASRRACFRA